MHDNFPATHETAAHKKTMLTFARLPVALISLCLFASLPGCGKKHRDPVSATSRPTSAAAEEVIVPAGARVRSHLVGPHETLYQLSRQYYGDGRNWRRIYYANRNRIADPGYLPVGIRLIIPPADEK